jgi:hypothetical protein
MERAIAALLRQAEPAAKLRWGHATAVELVAGVHANDDQFGLAAKRPVALPQSLRSYAFSRSLQRS